MDDADEEDVDEDDGVHLSRLDVPDSNHVPANRLVGQDCIRPTLFTVVSQVLQFLELVFQTPLISLLSSPAP